jgi:hypothetical protein
LSKSSYFFTIFLFVQMILRNSSLDGLFQKSHYVILHSSPLLFSISQLFPLAFIMSLL